MRRYARSVSPALAILDRVEAPTLLIQGQTDSLFNLNEATATYRTLKEQGTTTKMIWQSWGTQRWPGGPGELNLNTGQLGDQLHRTAHPRLVRPLPPQAEAHTDTGPAFAYYRDWRGAATARPRGGALRSSKKVYLSGDGKLVDNRAKVVRGSREIHQLGWSPPAIRRVRWPVRSACPTPQPYDTPGTYLGWDTDPAQGSPSTRSVGEGHPQGRLAADREGAELRQRRRQAGPLRQAVRRGAPRHQDAGPPADRAGAGTGRHPAVHRRPARYRAPLRGRAPTSSSRSPPATTPTSATRASSR